MRQAPYTTPNSSSPQPLKPDKPLGVRARRLHSAICGTSRRKWSSRGRRTGAGGGGGHGEGGRRFYAGTTVHVFLLILAGMRRRNQADRETRLLEKLGCHPWMLGLACGARLSLRAARVAPRNVQGGVRIG